jgi:hypothetical protein
MAGASSALLLAAAAIEPLTMLAARVSRYTGGRGSDTRFGRSCSAACARRIVCSARSSAALEGSEGSAWRDARCDSARMRRTSAAGARKPRGRFAAPRTIGRKPLSTSTPSASDSSSPAPAARARPLPRARRGGFGGDGDRL